VEVSAARRSGVAQTVLEAGISHAAAAVTEMPSAAGQEDIAALMRAAAAIVEPRAWALEAGAEALAAAVVEDPEVAVVGAGKSCANTRSGITGVER